MKRKLCSILMSIFAVVLLMGAGVKLDDGSAILTVQAAELSEVQAAPQTQEVVEAQAGQALDQAQAYDLNHDSSLTVNGKPVGNDTKKVIVDGTSYVSLRAMAMELDSSAVVSWNPATATIKVNTDQLSLTVGEGDEYLVANGRYLQLPHGLQVVDGVTMIPLTVLAKAFDATVRWEASTNIIYVTTGSGGIQPGELYYDSDDLFWLSRLIFAESGGESMEGKIAVGNVVLNRMAHPAYPNTLTGVISQKNQFSTYRNGALANRTPNVGSVVAAKLVLDGAVVPGLERATHFDTGGNTWASRNKTCLAVIGGHKFYG